MCLSLVRAFVFPNNPGLFFCTSIHKTGLTASKNTKRSFSAYLINLCYHNSCFYLCKPVISPFRCVNEPDGSLKLHYYSVRSGLQSIVTGQSSSPVKCHVGALFVSKCTMEFYYSPTNANFQLHWQRELFFIRSQQ